MKTPVALLLLAAALPAQAAKTKPKSSLSYQYYSKGVELASHKKWEEAMKQFASAIELNTTYASSYVEFARAAVMLGHREQALDKLSAGLDAKMARDDKDKLLHERENLSEIFYTNDTFQRYQNGLNYLRLDRSGSALEALDKALKTEPDNVLVLVAYARALRQEDRTKDAQAALTRALALNPVKRDARVELADLELAAEPEQVLALLDPQLMPRNDERVAWVRAQALALLKRNREAIETVRVVYEAEPGSTYAPLWLGKLYAQEPNGAWNARKYLMTFLRRTDVQALEMKDEASPDAKQLKAARLEADQILSRVNRSLE